ncbi:nucleotide-binding domain-containing protein [Staphylococcus pseudintermedius]|uniref:nucleotide-binding domain-containing protein n=1 Tax=Staphylococcus pseudintermedius TaxID=283734 RepID=UPI0029287D02|nr:nucleotidyltransferase [Staphylococcus pseudintermedius]MDU9264453.1 nucleotidyltransferase [Staphylococcus pseudintermedius]MDU9320406.1 nucleotidyltransferase [Staphylococcus pseudintermedius]
MYDCSKEFNKFYRTKVVLSAKEQNELREKRKLNIKRLKDGLLEYNEEKKTDYKISEERIQGSMAMHTITQNDENDYDIDVGIVFESDNLNGLGPLATRNMVANALERKTKQFTEEPDVKTSCVRLKYTSIGYHVDFAVFKRYKEDSSDDEYTYEHAGLEWSVRHIKALEEWFNNEIKSIGDNLRKVTRLSKMFCKSRDSWKNMPSGLIQTVLCDEKLTTNYTRLDEIFYYTMQAIVHRLNIYLEVTAPVDNGRALVTREVDYQRMRNWKSRLESNLQNLEVLFDIECTYKEAINAWGKFFNHSYWEELELTVNKKFSENQLQDFNDTEEFIEDLYPIYEQYDVTIDCKVSGNGFSVMSILEYLDKFAPRLKKFIPHNFSIKCRIGSTNCPSYDKILWKVLNVGTEAERRNDIRGQIQDRGKEITEKSKFYGEHYIECYLIKNEVCVAIGHVNVPIGGS